MAKKRKSSKSAADKKPRTAPASAFEPVLSMPEAVQLRPEPEAPIAAEPSQKPQGVSLNFRVAPDFRRAFRRYAVDHDMQLNNVLRLAFERLEKDEP